MVQWFGPNGAQVNINIQALITGRVSDSVTGQRLTSPFEVLIEWQLPGEPEYKIFPAAIKHSAGIYFSAAATARTFLPMLLDPGDTVNFRATVSAPGYSQLQQIAAVSGADITPATTTRTINGNSFELELINAPLVDFVFDLEPLAVSLSGLVVEDHDIDTPVAGASVQLLAPEMRPAVTTDSNGRFRLDNLPISSSVTIQADFDGEITTITHFVDFSTPVNNQIISLNG